MAIAAAQPGIRARFRKNERLTGRDRLKLVATTGRSVKAHPFRLTGVLIPLDTSAPAQVAFAIPKRHMKLAVHRNRQRRLLRETYRLNKHRWYDALQAAGVQCAWLVVFQGGPPLGWPETQEKLSGLFDRWVKEHVRPDR